MATAMAVTKRLSGLFRLLNRKIRHENMLFKRTVATKGKSKVCQVEDTKYYKSEFEEEMDRRASQAERSLLLEEKTFNAASEYLKLMNFSHKSHCITSDLFLLEVENLKEAKDLKSMLSRSNESEKREAIHYRAKLPDIVGLLKKAESVQQQVDVLVKVTSPSERSKCLRFLVCNEIGMLLKKQFPNIKVDVFGSTATGLGHLNSDLDVQISFQDPSLEKHKVSKVLERSKKFDDILPILHAKVPIVKCRHITSQINCDISITPGKESGNSNAVVAAEMLYTMGKVNSCFPDLLRIIKLWAASNELCVEGSNTIPHGITWTCMVLLYLQQIGHLPPVRDIYYPSDHDTRMGKVKPVSDIQKQLTPKDADLVSLLKGFCDFYSGFGFKKHVLCIQDGCFYKLDKFDFHKRGIKGHVRKGGFSMCIPLELKHNTSPNVAANVRDMSVRIVKQSLKHLRKGLDQTEQHPIGLLKTWGNVNNFTVKTLQRRAVKKPKKNRALDSLNNLFTDLADTSRQPYS